MTAANSKFYLAHFVYPLCVLILISLAIEVFDLDLMLADYFYALQGGSWAWKSSWLLEHFFHRGGRNLSFLCAGLVFVAALIARFKAVWTPHRKPLLFLIVALLGSSALISVLKFLLAVPCPWEFARYGGTLDYYNVITQLHLRNGDGCFPAGQASAGYAWVALYFFAQHYQSRLRLPLLAIAIVVGMILGCAQQIRGAHFISHDVWSLATCWFFSLSLYAFMFKRKQAQIMVEQLQPIKV